MATQTQTLPSSPAPEPGTFSLILGGPLFQLWRRLGLVDDSLKLLHRRILVSCAVCWLPLLVISAVEGRLLPGTATVSFLQDIEMHVRFLIALPLLILAELVVHRRLMPIVGEFQQRDLLPEDALDEFKAAVASALRWRNSLAAELTLLGFVYVVGVLVWQRYTALDASTWYVVRGAEGSQRSIAGLWYGYISLPLFQFLMLRWYFRIGIWARLLRKVARIPLKLVPTHPDHAGGLGFLSATVNALAPVAVAHGALLAGQLADRILHLGAKLPDFKAEILTLVAFLWLIMLGPMLVFVPPLARLKRAGMVAYEGLAQRYVREFHDKWIHGDARSDESLLGSADIQSLADLNNSVELVKTMRVAPITRNAVVQLTVMTLLPMSPLLLTIMPLEELLKQLLGVLF